MARRDTNKTTGDQTEREMTTMRNSVVVELLNLLPEKCISDILSLTTPRDVGRMSTVSTTFQSAAESDVVWDRFLPSDYQDIIARSNGSSPQLLSAFAMKKQLYLHLCDTPLLIDDGMKSFSLDKWTGKKCFMMAARDLTIVWTCTPDYWTWISLPESRFAEVAELLIVCWLEIRGKINTGMLSPGTKYAAYLVFKLTENACGFERHPVEVSIDTFGVESNIRTLYLDPREGDERSPKQRKDGWLEIEFGEYFNEGGQDQELEMSLMEVKGGYAKSGLIIEGIEIRPIESK